METRFALFARFGSPFIALEKISEEFLGLKPKTAESKAKACALPFPTLKLRDSERSPTMVKIEDLASYLDKKYADSQKMWNSVQTR